MAPPLNHLFCVAFHEQAFPLSRAINYNKLHIIGKERRSVSVDTFKDVTNILHKLKLTITKYKVFSSINFRQASPERTIHSPTLRTSKNYPSENYE
jgi:hypothetical protein